MNSALQRSLQEAFGHHKAGRLDRAQALYRKVLAAAPRNVQVLDLSARLAAQQGRNEDAIRWWRQAVAADESAVPCATRLATTLISVQRIAEAETTMRLATAKNSGSAAAWSALAQVLRVQGRFDEAVSCHQRAIAIEPEGAEGWCQFGLTLSLAGENLEALKCQERALSLQPGLAAARFGRAQVLHKLYRLEEAIADYGRFLELEPKHHQARSYRLFALQSADKLTREQLFEEHRAYGRAVGSEAGALAGYDLKPDRRLRVAILSPDLREHSCAYFLEPLLQHLDATLFELYLYHDHFSEDGVSARLKTRCAVWRNFVGQTNAAVEGVIRADRPDILIDLAGHIGMAVRLPVLARRVAPVQITYLGYPDTTGVPAIDYRFTDGVADPEGEADAFATEQLVRFAPTAWAYEPPKNSPDVMVPPCAAGAPVTFGCFNSPTKLTDRVFGMWGRLLSQLPGSRLLLKARDFDAASVREYLLGRLETQGVPLDRVELLPRTMSTREHLALYERVDVALDTFPYAGTTTTCEALWMGRPVVTWCGGRHAARVGASLLTAVGHGEWIATTAEEYIAIAVRLGSAPAEVECASRQLRARMASSPLLDHAGQSHRFAAAIRLCWHEKTSGL